LSRVLAHGFILALASQQRARGEAMKAYGQRITQRATVTEFGSVEQAAAHNSPAYQEALKALGNACERDVRIVGGVD
jgi:uncharacterized protein (DUF1330 family)